MKKIEIRYGLLMLGGFVLYFFAMKALGWYTEISLRVLNIIIHGSLAYLAMRAFRQEERGEFSYLKTFGVGFRTSIIAVLGFAAFQAFYLGVIDPGFMAYIRENAILGNMLNPFNASLFLIAEGVGVTFLTSYIGMRLLTAQEEVPAVR